MQPKPRLYWEIILTIAKSEIVAELLINEAGHVQEYIYLSTRIRAETDATVKRHETARKQMLQLRNTKQQRSNTRGLRAFLSKSEELFFDAHQVLDQSMNIKTI